MRRWQVSGMVAFLTLAGAVSADTITVKGVVYKDVYVRESDSRYYVQLPREGRTISVARAEVKPDSIVLTADDTEREALLKQWKDNYVKRHPKPTAKAEPGQAPRQPGIPAAATRPGLPPGPRGMGMASLAPTPFAPASGSRAEDMLKGIRERRNVTESGVPKLVLRGSTKKDPNRDQMLLEQALAEQAAVEEELARQQRAYEEFLFGPMYMPYSEEPYPAAWEQNPGMAQGAPGMPANPGMHPAQPSQPALTATSAPELGIMSSVASPPAGNAPVVTPSPAPPVVPAAPATAPAEAAPLR